MRPIFPMVGGALSVDFVNSIERHRFIQPFDWFDSPLALLRFLRMARCWPAHDLDLLGGSIHADGLAAAAAAERARHLRDVLYRLFRSRIDRVDAPAADLRALDLHLRRVLRATRLVECGGHLVQQHVGRGWDRWMGPVVLDAVRVLTGPAAARLRMCEASQWNGCGRLFLIARRHDRRWCTKLDCGRRMKRRRARARRSGAGRLPVDFAFLEVSPLQLRPQDRLGAWPTRNARAPRPPQAGHPTRDDPPPDVG